MVMLLVSAAALVDASGRVLVQQRPEGSEMAGLWEFPGGKVEAGETPEEALGRELREELGIAVAVAAMEPVAFVTHPLGARHLLLLLYLCTTWGGTPRALHATHLQWVSPDALATLDMPPADGPLVVELTRRLM